MNWQLFSFFMAGMVVGVVLGSLLVALAESREQNINTHRRRVAAILLAQKFHETYERLAPKFGYETRRETAKPWSEVPEENRNLMIAVCEEILEAVSESQPEKKLRRGENQ